MNKVGWVEWGRVKSGEVHCGVGIGTARSVDLYHRVCMVHLDRGRDGDTS